MTSNIEKLGLKLGRQTADAGLDPIPRALGREGLSSGREFFGHDMWNAWEVSFLLPSGKPVVYHMQAAYPCDSLYMVESKSFKLFLNSFNNQTFEDVEAFAQTVSAKLSRCIIGPVHLTFYAPDQSPPQIHLKGSMLDVLDFKPLATGHRREKIRKAGGDGDYLYHSHLLRSNCPVTGQPDWGSVLISGRGPKPVAESLLDYIVSYRNHQGFHESCCEMIFDDLCSVLEPEHLTVTCFYTRRGGLDINPCRSTQAEIGVLTATVWRQ